MSTVMINARIDRDLKAQAEQILNNLGIGTTDAIRIFFAQIVDKRGLPFEVTLTPTRPTHPDLDAFLSQTTQDNHALWDELAKR